MSKLDLKNAMDALNVKLPLKLFVKAPTFQAPNPVNELRPSVKPHGDELAPLVPSQARSLIVEQSGSTLNPVQNERGQNLTLSNLDPVKIEPGSIQTGSIVDPVQKEGIGKPRSQTHYTQVPHELLRGMNNFTDPLDFMVYLHLYSYSWGFSRETASMSQGQLEEFTGSARNTIRRSLERLSKQGWIKMVEDYECARMSRRWKVIQHQEIKKPRGSISNPIHFKPGPALNEGGSKLNPPTGFKMNPYKERIHKEKSKNSLSCDSVKISEYFESIQAFRKRESERRAYLGLKQNFSDSQIELCFQFLKNHGTPGTNEVCHSPMAYLATAIVEILLKAEAMNLVSKNVVERERSENAARIAKEELERREQEECEEREKAFVRFFRSAEAQTEAIARYAIDIPGLNPNGPAARSVAILNWWNSNRALNPE